MARRLCLLGLTNEELAKAFGVGITTLERWIKRYPDFRGALKSGKDEADAEVADRLFKRAMGFEHDDEEIKVVSIGGGQGSSVQRVPVRKIYPPDTTAAIFWLKNRQPALWRDKQVVENQGAGTVIMNVITGVSRAPDDPPAEDGDA